jgi:hypothetical protein
MTVALGPKGNNLILGGRLNQVSAEEAYTVSPHLPRLETLLTSHTCSILPHLFSARVLCMTVLTTC